MEKIKLKLNDDESIYMELEEIPGERRVSLKQEEIKIEKVTKTLSILSEKLFEPIVKNNTIDLDEVSLELNVGFTLESGGLTQLIIKGQGSLAFKVNLVWRRNKK